MSTKSMFSAILVLLVAGFATWLFLPLANESVEVVLPETTFVTEVGPFQVNWMLIVLLVAAGTPLMAGVMGLVMYWLGGKSSGGVTPDLQVKSTPKASAGAGAAEVVVATQELSLGGKLAAGFAILISIAVLALFVYLILTPGIRLF